jgi:hypothetical protein
MMDRIASHRIASHRIVKGRKTALVTSLSLIALTGVFTLGRYSYNLPSNGGSFTPVLHPILSLLMSGEVPLEMPVKPAR